MMIKRACIPHAVVIATVLTSLIIGRLATQFARDVVLYLLITNFWYLTVFTLRTIISLVHQKTFILWVKQYLHRTYFLGRVFVADFQSRMFVLLIGMKGYRSGAAQSLEFPTKTGNSSKKPSASTNTNSMMNTSSLKKTFEQFCDL